MTIIERIDRIPVGEVVPKQVLVVLKRAGVIEDYSPLGYLKEQGSNMRIREYKGRFFRPKYLDGCLEPYLIKADITPTCRMDYMQFKGDFKRIKGKSDNLVAAAWDLHYKTKLNVTKFLEYFMRKERIVEQQYHRVSRRVNRSVCLYGAIL